MSFADDMKAMTSWANAPRPAQADRWRAARARIMDDLSEMCTVINNRPTKESRARYLAESGWTEQELERFIVVAQRMKIAADSLSS